MTSLARDVGATMAITVSAPADLEVQIAVARLPGMRLAEELRVTVDDEAVAVAELVGAHGSRIHQLSVTGGQVAVTYSATVITPAHPIAVTPTDRSIYLRPSRYVECDKLFRYAETEFDVRRPPAELLDEVVTFVRKRLRYTPGASDPIDGAVDTLLAGAGVCRDFAHLVVALLRALYIPARVAAVYAPGCFPMDFHAVVEALVDDEWVVVDATGLAPRQSMTRIATGRDAADIAFLDNHGGAVSLDYCEVTAIVRGHLPLDDGTETIALG
ncbi:MAG: transglutaminase family protein [Gordonia sp. (in: high G+C Gram-positive bacteria)]